MNNTDDTGAILERLRILDEIEAVEIDLRTARSWSFTDETSGLVAELAELNAQLQELES